MKLAIFRTGHWKRSRKANRSNMNSVHYNFPHLSCQGMSIYGGKGTSRPDNPTGEWVLNIQCLSKQKRPPFGGLFRGNIHLRFETPRLVKVWWLAHSKVGETGVCLLPNTEVFSVRDLIRIYKAGGLLPHINSEAPDRINSRYVSFTKKS